MSRVLLVSSSYPFYQGDFHARFVHDMARALIREGDEAFVLTPQCAGLPAGVERWEGVVVRRFAYPGVERTPVTGGEGLVENLRARPWRAPSAAGLMASFVREVRSAYTRLKPDLVVSHWLVPTSLAVAGALVPGPVAHVAHGSDVRLLARLPARRAVGRLLRRRGPILSTSPALSALLRRSGIAPDVVDWHLGVDPVGAAAVEGGPPPTLSAMGRLIEGKGLRRLVEVAARLDGWQVEIAGDGPLRAELSSEIASRGLEGRVRLVGVVLDEEKARFLRRARLFAFLPEPDAPGQLKDNLPVSVLEAMSAGVPVIATRAGALPDLLAEGGGLLVEPDPAAIAEQVLSLRERERAVLGDEAARVAARRSWSSSLEVMWRAALEG